MFLSICSLLNQVKETARLDSISRNEREKEREWKWNGKDFDISQELGKSENRVFVGGMKKSIFFHR
jgi:hypothetical protein